MSKTIYTPFIYEQMFHGEAIVKAMKKHLFGVSSWMHYFNVPLWKLYVPTVPREIYQIIKKPCPFVKTKSIAKTHFLFLAPNDRYDSLVIPRLSIENIKPILDYTLLHKIITFPGHNVRLKWYLMPIEGVCVNMDPLNKSCRRLSRSYSLASQTEELFKMLLYTLRVNKTQKYPFVYTLDAEYIRPYGNITMDEKTSLYKIGRKNGMMTHRAVAWDQQKQYRVPLMKKF